MSKIYITCEAETRAYRIHSLFSNFFTHPLTGEITIISVEASTGFIANSFNIYEPARVPGWNYFGYSWMDQKPSFVFRKPMAAMVDLTNDLGVAILQDYSYSRSNFAFSPYGVASVLVVLYEGARGESARQIHRAVRFPWDKDITRIGFRDIHRHLRSYFSHEGYLSGITLSKDGSTLKPEYKRILRFYGYDVDVDTPEKTSDIPPNITGISNEVPPVNSTTPTNEIRTTGGYDVTTGKDPQETNIEASTIKPEDITTSSSSETMTTLITTENRDSLPSATTTTVTTSLTEKIENEMVTEATETSVVTTTEEQNEGNMEIITEKNEQSSESIIHEDTEQTSSGENIQVTEEGVQQSTQGNEEEGTDKINWDAIEQNTENANGTEEEQVKETQGDVEESTFGDISEDPWNITSTTTTDILTSEDSYTVTDPITMREPVTENTEITISTDEVEGIQTTVADSIKEEIVKLEKAKVVEKLTAEEGERNSRRDSLDNGMLIPQIMDGAFSYSDGRLDLANNFPDKRNLIYDEDKLEGTSEDWQEMNVTLIAEGGEVKWEPKPLDEFLKDLMREREVVECANCTERLTSGKNIRWRRHERDSKRNSAGEKLQLTGLREPMGNSIERRLPVDVQTSAKLKRRCLTKEKRNISEFLKMPPVTDLSLQLQNGMFDSHVSKDTDLYRVLPKFLFLVDGAIDTPVPMMTYTNIFPFAYIPRLHSKALEFPLDDERYKLLILLPVERRGLRQLIYDLGSYSLRDVISVLRPSHVKAMVPTFMVEGFVILTPTLQKMGIWDVFDPRRADLSEMTSDPDLYVRNIEQSVTVVIRNYVEILDIQTRTMAARHIEEDFTASHPFLYFVMDTATNVALMAGQMLDPLNSRIY